MKTPYAIIWKEKTSFGYVQKRKGFITEDKMIKFIDKLKANPKCTILAYYNVA